MLMSAWVRVLVITRKPEEDTGCLAMSLSALIPLK